MTFKELITKYKEKDIIRRLIKLYPDQKKNILGYLSVLKELQSLKPKKDEMQIRIYKFYDKYDKKYYEHIDGIDKNKQIWAIEFTDWKEWLGMEIYKPTLKKYDKLDILCHCLWEMTFVGFSNKKIKREKQKLFKMMDNIKKEEERK